MNPEIQGTVHKIEDTQTFPSGFTKRVLVVNTGGEYPQFLPIEFVKDKTSILDHLSDGQSVTVSTNLRGNEYKDKYYINLQGWKLEASAPAQDAPQRQESTVTEAPATQLSESDDIPF